MRFGVLRLRACRWPVRAEVLTWAGAVALAAGVFVLPAGAQGGKSPGPVTGAASGAEAIPGQYIVTLKPGVNPDAVAQETRGRGDRVDYVYKAAGKGFAGKLSDSEVARLKADPRVLRVEPDHVVHALGTQSPTPSWGLDRIDERAPDAPSSYTYPTTASSVTAYVIDTGMYAGSSDFTGRIGAGQNFVSSGGTVDPANWADCNGHGTHVAGTIGGTTYGVAKGVTLVPVRVLDCAGNGTDAGVIAGLNWMTAQHVAGAKAVANLSLGGGYSQALNDAVDSAVADGIVVAVAAGNSNTNACNDSPSSAPNALTVGATDSGDARASFSSYGTCLDVFAPGVAITSDWIGSAGATNTISGTSMASPHVAGVAALYLELGQGANDLLANATTDFVANPGSGSPNKLVYVGTDPQTTPPRPANDAFAAAQTLAAATGTVAGTTKYATKESGEPNHFGNAGGSSIWYRFTPSASGTATLDTFGSNFDSLLAVYRGTAVNALTQVAANDDANGGLQSAVSFSAVAAATYQVAVDGWNGASGAVTLHWAFPTGPPPPPLSGNTGWIGPSAQAADTGGDGNGYETGSANALADDGIFAVDLNGGTGSSTSCTSALRDRHRFAYAIALPAGVTTVTGIEVQLQAKADSTSGSPKLCVQLSWDGGASWTSTKTTNKLTTSEAAHILGRATEKWGRTWNASEFASNFRVRVIDIASSTDRDYSLDWVAVRVTY